MSTRRWQRKAMVAGVAALACLTFGSAGPSAAGEKKPAHRSGAGEQRALAREFTAGVKVLAADAMEGRGLATAGIGRAANWIEKKLRSIGLDPAFGDGYRQSFQVKTGVERAAGNSLEGAGEDDWTPLGFSSSGDFGGELAFVGYGIDAASVGYREFDGIDLTGKVVLMLRYEPQEKDEASPFDGRRPSRWSALRYKTLQARERGARAVVFVTGPAQDEGQDRLPVLRNDGPESPAGLPVIQVKTSVAQRWLEPAGVDLAAFQTAVDRDLSPRSVGSTGVHVTGRVALEATYATTDNLAGTIPGRGDLANEAIVVGAHYDHLGMGGDGSMRPGVVAVHNGADDNASGTVAALLIGKALKDYLADRSSHRAIVVALFSGEEAGLAGSSRFVENPPVPIDRIVGMVNLDMVGMLREDRLVALGSESGEGWADRIARAAARVDGLEVTGRGDGYGPSDQTSFYAAGVPVLHLFTGAHEAYHTPDDDAGILNAEGAARVVRFAAALGEDLALEEKSPVYARSASGPVMGGDSRGYGAYLGTVPDYRAMEATEGGVLLGDVRRGGPADLAGIRGGDRIVGMAGTRIENLYDMTYALQDNKPGETIDVVVIRDGDRRTLRATLGSRSSMKGGEAPSQHGTPAASQAASPPHPIPTGGEKPAEPGIDPFYEGRPGPEFTIEAGRPFGRTWPAERRLSDVRQLTFGGENAEAYFSPDGRRLIYQATRPEGGCDQQYVMDLDTGATKRISSGKGRTTCGYYDFPEGDRIVYSSTETAGDDCPAPPGHSQGYVWALYEAYDIWEVGPDGAGARRLTETPGYDAEATWCHRGGRIVFTSVRDGDLDLYLMDEAGDVTRLTDIPGYDGGAFFSPDCSEIVWRASRPQGDALADYRRLLAQGLIRPNALEIFTMKSDGSEIRQITSNGAANFCPTFTADGRRIIYASNAGPGGGREFDLWIVPKEGGDPEQVTHAPGFDGFPQFSPDGRWLVWSSNRADPDSRETNLFIARWID